MKTIFITILMAAILLGCSQVKTKPIETSGFFNSDNPPVTSLITSNPLQYASERIGLDLAGFELPRANEGYYRLACRFPIIDAIANRPLYMKQWAEDTAEQINENHRKYGLQTIVYGIKVLNGENVYDKDYGAESADFEWALSKSNFTPRYKEILLTLYRSYLVSSKMVKVSRMNLSKDDLKFFYANPSYFMAPDGKKMPSITGSVDTHFQFIERARRFNYTYLFMAAQALAPSVQYYLDETRLLKAPSIFIDQSKVNETFRFDTPDGPIIISGFGNDTHSEDSPFLIDLGGDDAYTNNAGGSYSPTGVAICIDHSGNDFYNAPDKNYVQGFGFLGVGFLVDMAGNDRYVAKHFSQGIGIMGVGAIYDAAGNDTYDACAFVQGAGMFGLGMLLDSDGNDFYDCATNGQGSATSMGLGILSDLGGNDTYKLAINKAKDNLGADPPGYGQGGALSFRAWPFIKKLTAYGGIGILTDAAGDDHYETAGWCDQGGSYIMSLGALVDFDGNDHYKNDRGGGSAIHTGNGILIDKNGDDVYETGFLGFGSGSDRSNAVFIDYHGNDTYKCDSGSMGAGCKPLGFSLFIDYEGNDKYSCKQPTTYQGHDWDSCGGVWPESTPWSWPYAICLDLGGKDDYQIKNRANNSERLSYGHGIHLDSEWSGGDVIGKIDNPLEPYVPFLLIENINTPSVYREIHLLQNPDVFVRFQAIGRISGYDAVIAVPQLVGFIVNSNHRQFNRDIMECLHYFLTRNQITDKEVPDLIKLLKAKDEEVRTIMAHNLGLWEFKQSEDALIETVKTDASGRVRRFAMASLLLLKSEKAIPLARELVVTDPSEDVRRVASSFLGRIDKSKSAEVLIKVMDNDPSYVVRYAAADAFSYFRDERALDSLRRAAQASDYYLKRAAAKGLATLGKIEGIAILIDSMSFLSIDTGYNYGENIPNYIAAYAGTDISERYDQAKWKEWFQKNKDKIDIKKNVDKYLDYLELSSAITTASEQEKITKYEGFLAKYPGHEPAKEALGNLLNGVAWNLVTASQIDNPQSQISNRKLGLQYAIRAVELNPIPMIIDTLIEAYYANGNINKAIEICQEELKKNPNEKMFKDRLDKYLKETEGK